MLDFTGVNTHPPFTPMPPAAHNFVNFHESVQVPQRPSVVPVAEHNRRASLEFAGMMPRNFNDFRGPMIHQQSVAQIEPLQEVDKWFQHQNALLKRLSRQSVD